jgi:hypothetical protein
MKLTSSLASVASQAGPKSRRKQSGSFCSNTRRVRLLVGEKGKESEELAELARLLELEDGVIANQNRYLKQRGQKREAR